MTLGVTNYDSRHFAIEHGHTSIGYYAALAALGLTSWLKTTGGKGLHVVVPLAGPTTWDRVSGFARAVAERIANAAPERYLTEASRAARGGKVFLDWLRNTRGATWIAPWSVRSRAGA